MKFQLFAVCAIAVAGARMNATERALLWSASTNASYDGSGSETSENTSRVFYDQRANPVRMISTAFITDGLFGVVSYYDTNIWNFSKDGSLLSIVDDSVLLTNGYPFQVQHSITTTSYNGNEFREVIDRTVTMPDGHSVETITTATDESSSDYRRDFSEVRNVEGNLLSWSLNSWTNDPAHSQQFTLFEFGENDESSPDFVEKSTNTLDSFGNAILSTVETEFGGFVWSSVTSNSYVIDQNGKVLSWTSETDNGADGTIDGTTIATLAYDKAGNLTKQDSKSFGADASFQLETVAVFSYDKFGNLINEEDRFLNADGTATGRSTFTTAYVPRGHSFDHPPAVQHFLDQIRARTATPRLRDPAFLRR